MVRGPLRRCSPDVLGRGLRARFLAVSQAGGTAGSNCCGLRSAAAAPYKPWQGISQGRGQARGISKPVRPEKENQPSSARGKEI